MRLVLQRVNYAKVTVEGQPIAEIGNPQSSPLSTAAFGVVILLGIGPQDGEAQVRAMAEKTAHLRIFEDAQGKMNLSLLDIGGRAIVVSQFTLYADTNKGRRPSFNNAALPEQAQPLVERFAEIMNSLGIPTQTGEFGAHMQVEIHNDGPVTISMEN